MVLLLRIYFKLTVISFLILLFSACEFDPHGEHIVDIEVKEPVYIKVDLNVASDTITLIKPSHFTYSIDVGNRRVNQLKIWFGDQLIEPYNNASATSGNFYLYPESYATGLYELRIAFIANSGTGSLADRLGAEVLTGERKWIIQIDNDPIHPHTIQDVKPDKGRLLIKWKKYDRVNFYRYTIYRNHDNEPFAIIEDQNQQFVYDSLYIGGKVTYRIDIHGYGKTARGEKFFYSDTYPQIKEVENDKLSTVTFAWDKSKYYANFASYSLYKSGREGDNFTLIKQFTDINDTTITLNDIPFGGPVTFKLITSAYPNSFAHYEGTYVSVSTGQTFIRFSNVQYIPANQSYYLQTWDSIFRFEASNLSSPVASISRYRDMSNYLGWFSISENGQHAYVNEKDAIVALDPMTLNTKLQYDVTDMVGYSVSPGRSSVSNYNQIIFMSAYVNGGGAKLDSVWYVDFNAQPLKAAALGNHHAYGFISNSGKYYYTRKHVMQLNSGSSDTLGSIPLVNPIFFQGYLKFLTGDDKEELLLVESIYENSETILTWLSLPDLQQLRRLSVPYSLGEISIDLHNNYLGGVDSFDGVPSYLIFDLTTGVLLKAIPATPSMHVFYFQNKVLFSSYGTYMEVDI